MIKFTEEGQKRRHEQLEEFRNRLSRVKKLNYHKDSVEWKSLKALLEGFIESEDRAIKLGVIACSAGGYYDMNERGFRKETEARLVSDIRVAHERKAAFELVIDLVERTDDQVAVLNDAIKNMEAKYKEAKEHLT